ncbi:family A G protein-coupled receptor-like protein [Cryphonectria parasitica EP155]|uniref:Family A G protein-coupled receptor-like protein n=1 Tax=Cryphonectria parasitica (strain ATCC 38755 / EP155) TaxID=660469 RepID=A0A9P4XQL2_CRYP1|nr:family A G protein-coupled receptor-like protein [Cryphonectria parasitica EP155]KAF3759922.1 family A G protein-coupled receptor-like protein [Cryphonectria parasitica EP155]
MSGNQALNVNSVVAQHADLEITVHASDWYFAVCAVMGVSTLVFMGMAMTKPQTHRLFHYITAGITAVACIAYWSMGSDLGQVPIQAEFIRPGTITNAAGTREIFYVRYIDWFVTTPLLLTDLLLTAGVPWPTLLITILADEIMIVTGLVGALTQTSYKWGYWVFGMFAFFFVVYELVVDARRHASALGGTISSTFVRCGVLTIFLWFLYPIAWGLSEGGNVIHPDSEAIFYGILDIFAKPGFGILLLLGHNKIDPAALGLTIRQADHTREKASHPTTGTYDNAHNGTHNGTHTGTHNGTHNGTSAV